MRRVLRQNSSSDTPEEPERDNTEAAQGAPRFERRQAGMAGIVAAAIPVLNGQGFKGMRLTAVAELVGLKATGVTYDFPRKEELAVACLEPAWRSSTNSSPWPSASPTPAPASEFAAMISDANAEGAARPVDSAVAGALFNAAIDVASDVRMAPMITQDRVVKDYAPPLFAGLLRP